MRIKKRDNVQVLSGNDKGKTGEVLEVGKEARRMLRKNTWKYNSNKTFKRWCNIRLYSNRKNVKIFY